MRNKKFFAKVLAFAMVMGTVGVHGAVASPVSVVKAADTTIKFTAADYEVEITAANGEKYVCLQVLKDSKGEKVSGEYWYAIPSGDTKVKVDLSFLKATKKQYIRAYGLADSESAILEIPAQPKTVIKYDAKKQAFVDKSKNPIDDGDLANYEYKTLYGSAWSTSNLQKANYDIAKSATAGTTILVRLKANTTTNIPAGTEVKVKIAAAAKAPKVKVDFNKDAITLPKGAEIAVTADLKTAPADTAWKEASGKLTQKELLGKAGVADTAIDTTLESGYTLFVRTKKTEKKAASNMAIVTVKATPVLKPDASDAGTIKNGGTDKIACTFTDDDATLAVTSTAGTVWAYSLDGGKKWVTIEGTSVKLNVKKGDKFMLRALATEDTFASNTVEVENTGTPASGSGGGGTG